MMSQSLAKSDGPMNLRWATEDPNPGAKKRNMDHEKQKAFEHMQVTFLPSPPFSLSFCTVCMHAQNLC